MNRLWWNLDIKGHRHNNPKLRLKLRAYHQLDCAQVMAQSQGDKRISVRYQVKVWSFNSSWVQVGSQLHWLYIGRIGGKL